MKPAFGRRRLATLTLLSLLVTIAGCAGSGQVEFISLNYRAIDPPSAKPGVIDLDTCTWWSDADGRVWIAMGRDASGLGGALTRFAFRMSLQVEKLPAGAARNYVVNDETIRGLIRVGPGQSRLTSTRGILALYREGNRLRGSLRFEANRHAAQILGGWGEPGRSVVLARFVATPDTGHGPAIVSETEEAGFDRARLRGAGATTKPKDAAATRSTVLPPAPDGP